MRSQQLINQNNKIKEEGSESKPDTKFLEKAEELALNPNKEGGDALETGKDDLNFVPDEDVLEDLRKELGIPEEEIIKNQLGDSNKIEEETPGKKEEESKDIKEESQEKSKKE